MFKPKYEYCVLSSGHTIMGVRHFRPWDLSSFLIEDPMTVNTMIGPSGVNVNVSRYMEHSSSTFVKIKKKHVLSYSDPTEEIISMYHAVLKYTVRRVDPVTLGTVSNVVARLNQNEIETMQATSDVKPTSTDLSNLLSSMDERTMTRQ